MAEPIPTVEMVRCEVTGKLVPITECEYVIVKILKSKSADINDFRMFKEREEPIDRKPIILAKDESIKDFKEEDRTKLPSDIVGKANPDAVPVKRRSVIPPAFLSMMIPADSPGASQEIRRV